MKRRSFWGIVPGFYILISALFFAAYFGSIYEVTLPDWRQWLTPDPTVVEQRRIAREAKAAAKAAKAAEKAAAKAAAEAAARLAKEEALKQQQKAREKAEAAKAFNPVSLEAVARYESVTNAVIRTAYRQFVAESDSQIAELNRRLPAMNAYRLQHGLTDFPTQKITQTVSAFRGQVSLETAAAGAGDIVIAECNRRNRLAAAVNGVRAALDRKEAAVFDDSRLIYNIAVSGVSGFSTTSLQPLLQAYDRFDGFTPRQAAGFIDLCRRLNLDAATAAADRLISQITKEGEVYTIGSDDSVFCGQALVAAGKWKQNQRWIDVGKTMVATYWEAHPQIAFEEFYDLFDDRYFPKMKTVTFNGNRFRVFTCAEEFRFSRSGRRIAVTFGEQIGQTFFFLLYDLPNLVAYEMYSLNWNRDPNFQNYYSGAYFDPSRALFFVKIMIKVPDETIYLTPQQTVQAEE